MLALAEASPTPIAMWGEREEDGWAFVGEARVSSLMLKPIFCRYFAAVLWRIASIDA